MMHQHLIVIFVVFLNLMSHAGDSTFRAYAAPFYTMTFEEINSIKDPLFEGAVHQKKIYLDELTLLLRKWPILPDNSKAPNYNTSQLEKWSKNAEEWNQFRKSIFDVCNIPKDKTETCEKLLQARLHTLSLYSGSHQRLEDN